MTTEEKIFIAAGFDSEKIKMIRELMEEEAISFYKFCQGKMFVSFRQCNTASKIYELYQQSKNK
jgi:hypothetical protein